MMTQALRKAKKDLHMMRSNDPSSEEIVQLQCILGSVIDALEVSDASVTDDLVDSVEFPIYARENGCPMTASAINNVVHHWRNYLKEKKVAAATQEKEG